MYSLLFVWLLAGYAKTTQLILLKLGGWVGCEPNKNSLTLDPGFFFLTFFDTEKSDALFWISQKIVKGSWWKYLEDLLFA